MRAEASKQGEDVQTRLLTKPSYIARDLQLHFQGQEAEAQVISLYQDEEHDIPSTKNKEPSLKFMILANASFPPWDQREGLS